jgi:hypothetical protein
MPERLVFILLPLGANRPASFKGRAANLTISARIARVFSLASQFKLSCRYLYQTFDRK